MLIFKSPVYFFTYNSVSHPLYKVVRFIFTVPWDFTERIQFSILGKLHMGPRVFLDYYLSPTISASFSVFINSLCFANISRNYTL